MSKNKPTVFEWMATAVANVKAAMGIIPKKVRIIASQSLEVTQGIQKVIDNPAIDVLTALIPSHWDNIFVARIRSGLAKIMPYLYVVDGCPEVTEDNVEEVILCWVEGLRKMPKHSQNAMLQKLASLLASYLDNDALRQRLYDLYVQMAYVDNKG